MMEFIIIAIVFGVLIGGFLGAMATADCQSNVDRVIGIIAWIVACGSIISGLVWAERQSNKEAWNNGACPCGSAWELVNVEHPRNSGTLYHYTCRECGNIITLYGKGVTTK